VQKGAVARRGAALRAGPGSGDGPRAKPLRVMVRG
jgi:hypothetical protein